MNTHFLFWALLAFFVVGGLVAWLLNVAHETDQERARLQAEADRKALADAQRWPYERTHVGPTRHNHYNHQHTERRVQKSSGYRANWEIPESNYEPSYEVSTKHYDHTPSYTPSYSSSGDSSSSGGYDSSSSSSSSDSGSCGGDGGGGGGD